VPESPTDVIVAGIDGSQAARSAAQWAALDAERRGVTLRLVHAVFAPPTGGYLEPMLIRPQVTEQMRSRAGHLLQATADLLTTDHPGLRIETVQQDGAPVKVLLDQSHAATVATVVGADGDGRLAGAFFGSVTARLAAHGHGCIVVARPEPQNPPTVPGVVAVGVDGSPHARAAVGFAYEEAALRGATLLPIHTWNDKPLNHALGAYPLDINADRIDDQEHRLLETELAGWEQKYPEVPFGCGFSVDAPRRICCATPPRPGPTHTTDRRRQPRPRRIRRAAARLHQPSRHDPRRLFRRHRPRPA